MLNLHLMKQSGIARRLLLWFLVLALLPMIILSALVLKRSRDWLMSAEKQKLQAVADHNINRLDRWARERKRSVTNLSRLTASIGAIASFTKAFEVARNSGNYENSEDYKKAMASHAEFIKHLNFIAYQYKYPNIYLISKDGDIVAAINPNPILGKNLDSFPYSDTELKKVFKLVRERPWPEDAPNEGWIEGEISDFRPFPHITGRAAFIVSPVRDCTNNKRCGESDGVLAVQMPDTAIQQAALDNIGMSNSKGAGGLGNSGEVVIVSKEDDKIMIVAATRLNPKEVFTQSVPLKDKTKMVGFEDAIRTRQPGVGDMIDYKGHRTIAAWGFLTSSPSWGVVAKIDKNEAAAPATALYKDIFLLGGSMIIVVIALALFGSRSIYGPIGRLTQAVRSLPAGDLRRRPVVPIEGDSEISELSRTLNNAVGEVWLLQNISDAANKATGVETALRTALEKVCEHAKMLVGHVYEIDRDGSGELFSTSIWHVPEPDRFPHFSRVTEKLRLKPGVGLPGRVLESGQPEWVEDVKKEDGNYLSALTSDDIDVRGGFAFPVLVGKEVTAVLEFYTDQPAAPNRSLLRTMTTIGTLLGRAIERKREEQLLKEKAAAEAANQAKSAFLASVSHDLRTPLNAILGYSEMHYEDVKEAEPGMVSGSQKTPDVEARSNWEAEKQDIVSDLRKINKSGRDLLRIINNVLDLSRIEAGKMSVDPETFNVAAFVREVVDVDEPLIKESGSRFELHCSDAVGTMHADKMMVKRILFNLLGNARKFTKQGVISLSVERRAEGASEWMIFRVSDTGIGMTEEQQGRIFESFTQAEESTKRRYGGTGLGLTINKNFCQMMGGDISVESEPGRGTTFTVQLPTGVYAPQPTDVKTTSDLSAPPEGATVVLVIDDDPAMRELSKHFLGKEGFHVEAAASGEDGIRLARKLRPDIITLDVVMPGMDGYSVVSALRADEELRDIPVVMLTIVDEKSGGFPRGVAEYMNKPIDWERLTNLLNKYRRATELACTVLVIEDDEAMRDLLKRTLEKDGWEVETAENGRTGLERIAQHQPDLILLDLTMPEMDGFEFVNALRRDPKWALIPVAIITAKDITFEDRMRLSGCVEKFLEKGTYTREELLREVRDLVSACASGRKNNKELVSRNQ